MAIPYGSSSNATQTSFIIKLDEVPSQESRFLDVPQCLSLINRKLIRQLQLFPVQLQMEYDSSVSEGTEMTWCIEAAPNTYLVRKALRLAFKAWFDSTKEARSMTREARWMDFKIFLNDTHFNQTGNSQSTFSANLKPKASRPSIVDYKWDEIVFPTMQWQPTLIDSPDTGNDIHFQLFGETDSGEFGILDEFLKSYQLNVPSPDPTQQLLPQEAPYEDAFAQLSEEQSYILASRGSSPPYDADFLQICLQQYWIGIQNMTNVPDTVTAKSYYQPSSTPFFIAPCGLIQITNQAAQAHTAFLRVNVLHGKDRGINTGDI